MKIAFLDRDGTIIEDYKDSQWSFIEKPIFVSTAIETLQFLSSRDFKIIIITNQYLIEEGIITMKQFNNINNQIIDILRKNNIEVLDIFFCPHARNTECNCRKPNVGMLLKAIEKYAEVDLSNSFVCGDSDCDVEMGLRMKLKSFGINNKTNFLSADYTRINKLSDLMMYIT